MDDSYSDELREIKRKEKQLYNKRGIYPFLDDGIYGEGHNKKKGISGFQTFRLYDWNYYIEDDDE
jgi:hypothetical protein